ncbi:hypothetical protein IV203_027227 [Nitzschia inconspicua]|uniref:DUF6824 domain-containing protein n=1 Tax=Nitzschia inconspicua TaxID=303405 RepID=A0A9K3LZI8_9STRA|nr:hypothetical protein IV203_027227 [Nitzschia inconspicua]
MILKEGLSPEDVLLGRGTGSNDHDGNVRFRAIVKQVLRQSSAPSAINCTLNPSNKAACTKSSMAATVLSIVHERGGQFVRKASKAEIVAYFGPKANAVVTTSADEKMVSSFNWYVVVPRQVALEKAKQSFRHQKRVLHSEQERSAKVSKELAVASRTALIRSSSVVNNAGSLVWNDGCRATLDASSVLQMVPMQAEEEKEQQFHSKLLSQHLMKHTGRHLVSRLGNPVLPPTATGTNDSLAISRTLFTGNTASSSPSTSSPSTPTVLGLSAPVPNVSIPVWSTEASDSSLQNFASTLSTNTLLRALKQQQQQERQSQERQVALFILMAAAAAEAVK